MREAWLAPVPLIIVLGITAVGPGRTSASAQALLTLTDSALYPDPFETGNILVTAHFSEPAIYQVEIRDDRGQVVRWFYGQGQHVLWEWDGRDETDGAVPSGGYDAWLLARALSATAGGDVSENLGEVPVGSAVGRDWTWWPLRSTDKVFLHSRPTPEQLAQRELHVELARNEYEAVQIAIRPRPGFALEDVQVSLTQLRHRVSGSEFPAEGVTIYQVCHVKTHEPPPPYDYDFLGWHPDPLIETSVFDIAPGDTQGVWLQLKTPANIEAGDYHGTVRIEPANAAAVEIPFRATVWDFVLPQVSHCKTLFDLRSSRREVQEFVFEHRINPGRIYNDDPPSTEFLETFMPRGVNAVNLIYIRNEDCTADAKAEVRAKLDPVVELIRQRGWTDRVYIYGFDESYAWPRLKAWADWLQATYPDIPFGTTSRDYTYGVATGIDSVDFWTPLTREYDRQRADARRREGYEVWWYISAQPHHPYANWFIEYPVIEPRLLWWMTYQYNVDGFLYYALNRWPGYTKPLEGAPRTDWDPVSWGSLNGAGGLFYRGPDGPLTGMRFEMMRDGLEEYEYLWLLEQRFGTRTTGERLCRRLIRSLTEYTQDSEEFYRVRCQLARALTVGLVGDLNGDGLLGVGDAIKTLRMVVGLDPNSVHADANQNGSTDTGDAIKLLRSVVGLDQWPLDWQKARVTGTVAELHAGGSQPPLPGVEVTVGGQSATTDSSGQFEITCVPLDRQAIAVVKDGYAPIVPLPSGVGVAPPGTDVPPIYMVATQ